MEAWSGGGGEGDGTSRRSQHTLSIGLGLGRRWGTGGCGEPHSLRPGYNTPGVCHQLSNGFELKHGILSDDEGVKVKPMEMSPNLNLDIAPLLAYRPLFKIYAWVV